MSSQHILVVDDDPIILKLVDANLKARGFEVTLASDGLSALEAVKQDMPDLVILDLMMPGINGDEVCRQIRQTSDVPIIILTAVAQLESEIRLFELGANAYITKPFDIQKLLDYVKQMLQPGTATTAPL